MAFITTTANAISSGGTITGDLTISGDLTVSGGGDFAYSEVLTGDMKITNTAASTAFTVEQTTGLGTALLIDQNTNRNALSIASESQSYHTVYFDTPKNTIGSVIMMSGMDTLTTGSAIYIDSDSPSTGIRSLIKIVNDNIAAVNTTGLKIQQDSSGLGIDIHSRFTSAADAGAGLRLYSDDGAVMASGDRLGVIEFGGAEDTSSTITVGARIEAVADATWSASENGADMVFYTTDGNASQSEVMRLSADNNTTLADNVSIGGNLTLPASGKLFLDGGGDTYIHEQAANKVDFFVSNGTRMVLDANSSISLSNNDDGTGNTVFGYDAGKLIVSGTIGNTFIGHQVADGILTTAADNNVGVGNLALSGLLAGNENVAVGMSAQLLNESGVSNVAIGTGALEKNTAANNNTGVGQLAGWYTTGADNTYVGYYAGKGAAGADANNVGVGSNALLAIVDGSYNTVVGKSAATALLSGQQNVAIGLNALGTATTENYNVAVGTNAMSSVRSDTADNNVAIGQDALTGGAAALIGCVAIGTAAMNSTAGNAQTGTIAIGQNSLTALTTGSGNVAIGYSSASLLVEGQYNTVLGYLAFDAGQEDSKCTAIGSYALTNADVSDTGSAVDSHNTAVGYGAGSVITTGTNNTIIGSNSDPSANSGVNQTVLGAATTGVANNSVTLGNASVTAVYMSSDSQALVHSAGIQFAGTQVANAGANVLDDYEEGSYIPTLTESGDATPTAHSGSNKLSYTKIGRLVTVLGTIYINSIDGGSGYLEIELPFTPKANDSGTGYSASYVGTYSVDILGDGNAVFAQIEPSVAYVSLNAVRDANTSSAQISVGYYRFQIQFEV